MESVVGIFTSAEPARRAAEALVREGISRDHVSVLTPGSSEAQIHSRVETTETEGSGMGKAVGGVVGGAAGMGLGAAAASLLIPGVGPVVATGVLALALFGAGGAVGGAMAGGALEEKLSKGLPKDELYLYEDALRRGHSVVFALVEEKDAHTARRTLASEGAESLDAARESWWVGIRDAEKADYEAEGGDFAAAEPSYRQGFEAAMRRKFHRRGFEEASKDLRDLYPEHYGLDHFRRGYERGARHRQEHGRSTDLR